MSQAAPKKLCFVVGPIGADDSDDRAHADWLLKLIIEPVMAEFPDYIVNRADSIATPGMIDTQIITALRDADLVIADLSMLNPNAFYEIGIRHMVAKPIIHMQLADQRIPFDVTLYRAVKFSLKRPQDAEAAKALLKSQVLEAVAEGHQTDNPVTRALGQKQFRQNALPETKLLAAELASLRSEVAALKISVNSPAQARAELVNSRIVQLLMGKEPIQSPLAKLMSDSDAGASPWLSAEEEISAFKKESK